MSTMILFFSRLTFIVYRIRRPVDGVEEFAVVGAVQRVMGQLHEPQAIELQAERAGVDLRDPVVVEEQVSNGVLQAVEGAVAQLADLVGGEV